MATRLSGIFGTPLLATPLSFFLLSPARGRGWERGLQGVFASPFCGSLRFPLSSPLPLAGERNMRERK
jgi:hypothetical protein